MRRSTFRHIEDILRDYPKIDSYIEERENELRYPVKQIDENVGGGRSNKFREHQTDILITIDEDKRLNMLKKQRDVIDDCLDECGEDTATIVKELYFRKHPELTLDGMITSGMIHLSRSPAYQHRNQFIKDVAEGLGIYDVNQD